MLQVLTQSCPSLFGQFWSVHVSIFTGCPKERGQNLGVMTPGRLFHLGGSQPSGFLAFSFFVGVAVGLPYLTHK